MPIYGKLTATELLLVTNAHSVLGCVLNRSPLHGYYQQMFNAHLLCRLSQERISILHAPPSSHFSPIASSGAHLFPWT